MQRQGAEASVGDVVPTVSVRKTRECGNTERGVTCFRNAATQRQVQKPCRDSPDVSVATHECSGQFQSEPAGDCVAACFKLLALESLFSIMESRACAGAQADAIAKIVGGRGGRTPSFESSSCFQGRVGIPALMLIARKTSMG